VEYYTGYNGQRFSGCCLNVEKRKAPPAKLPGSAAAPAGLSGRTAETYAEAGQQKALNDCRCLMPGASARREASGLASLTADKSSFSLKLC